MHQGSREAAGGRRPAGGHRRRVPPRLVAHRLHPRLRRRRSDRQQVRHVPGHRRAAAAVNAAIRDVPDDMTVAVHTCRGNFKSTWLASGAYADFVAERVFTGLDVDGFFLEYDTERAGGFEPLRFVPKGKKVVLGLISSKFPELEKKDDLKRRIDAAARYVPMENLALSPQCGFSSTHHGNNLTEQQEVAKLKLCIDVAREVWG